MENSAWAEVLWVSRGQLWAFVNPFPQGRQETLQTFSNSYQPASEENKACKLVDTFFSFSTQAVHEQIDFDVYDLKSIFFKKQVATSKEDSLLQDLELDQKLRIIKA